MSNHWSPSAVTVSVSSSAVIVAVASNQISGVARIVNAGSSVAFCGFVTAAATAGESLFTPVDAGATFFMEYTSALPAFIATATATVSALYVQLGYMLK